jgi:hypothetical protein
VTEQLPVPPEVEHEVAEVNAPGPESIVKVIDVLSLEPAAVAVNRYKPNRFSKQGSKGARAI